MADHSLPTTTQAYANVLQQLRDRIDDLLRGLDPAFTTATNVIANGIRWTSAANKWQKWNGTSWGDLATTYAISISGNAGTVTNGVVTTGSYSDPAWITSLAGSKVSGGIAGNAGSATILQTARNINGVAFNGSGNITVNTVNALTIVNDGTGDASGSTFNGSGAIKISYNSIGAPKADGSGASGTWGISISGNAATVSNGLYSNGSYANPAWLTSLAGTKISGDIAGGAGKLVTAGWDVVEISGSLYFRAAGVNKFKMDTAGNFTAVTDVIINPTGGLT